MSNVYIEGREYYFQPAANREDVRVWRREDGDWTELDEDPVIDRIMELGEVAPEECDRASDERMGA